MKKRIKDTRIIIGPPRFDRIRQIAVDKVLGHKLDPNDIYEVDEERLAVALYKLEPFYHLNSNRTVVWEDLTKRERKQFINNAKVIIKAVVLKFKDKE